MNNITNAIPGPNANTNMKRLESLKDATHSLGLRDTRVTMRLVREGKLKAIQIGNRIMITTASLNKFAGC
ncbi:helix-turn-helix domain-containing protein [Bifidobacterium simiiventris]|uniref:helix-turn-helix domain-containing protein n=1 Tax=Bifidobacterium simiiventris TaxID=2834434 RepID=UPI001C5973DD|nr:helix-turn-helix domain-containing protein [Bifidobacterium simiiventris]MBW3078579.1 hypothetical protein [Bifidobacterium simiiventris]